MGRPRLQLNRENVTLEEIERAMDCTPSKKVFIRLQALKRIRKQEGRRWTALRSHCNHKRSGIYDGQVSEVGEVQIRLVKDDNLPGLYARITAWCPGPSGSTVSMRTVMWNRATAI